MKDNETILMQKTNEELSISYDVKKDYDACYDTDDFVICPTVTIKRERKSNKRKKKMFVGTVAKK